jgi:hypothetical protein
LIINESFSCFQVILIAALISVAFTSRLYCELADNLQEIYPDLNTVVVRSIFQSFAILCLIITIIILLAHIYGMRRSGRNFFYLNQVVSKKDLFTGELFVHISV